MIGRRFLVFLAASVVFSLPAYSQGAGGEGSPDGHARQPMGFDRLQGKYALTTDQRKQLQSLSQELFNQMQAKAPAMRAKKVEILNALTDANVDGAKVQQLQSDMNNQANDMANTILLTQIKQMQLLTPEQRAQLKPTSQDLGEAH